MLPRRVRVRNHNLLKGKRRLRLLNQSVTSGKIAAATARTSLQSWNAHLAHGHTWRLRRRSIRTAPGGPCRHSSGHDSPPFSLPTLPPSTPGVPA